MSSSLELKSDNSVIDYDHLAQLRANEVQAAFQKKIAQNTNLGKIDSLRHTILKYVVEANYEVAGSELERYISMKDDYPTFRKRVEPYVSHSQDIILAIKAKRNFPGLSSLGQSKQQEIFERVMDHFEELKGNLKRIEKIEREVKLDDIRSTVWVLKALSHAAFIILTIGFVKEVVIGLSDSFNIVGSELVDGLISKLFDLF